MSAQRATAMGFTLIEVMVAVTVLSMLMVLAVPALGDWVRNARVRSAAEALRSDLQMARAEAIRLNTGTRLQWVTSLASDCALSASGSRWLTNVGLAQSPAGACDVSPSSTASPFIISKSVSSSSSDVAVAATTSVIGFDPLGRQAATTNPTTTPSAITYADVSTGNGQCVRDGGAVRCLRVVVSLSGDSRICDRTRTAANDPMRC